MSPRARAGRLLGLAVLGLAVLGTVVAAGLLSVSAVHAASGGPSPLPSRLASEREAATRALRQVFRTSGPLPFERVPGSRARRAGGRTIYLSGNWSGYADDNTTGLTYTAATATWVEPKARCTAAEDDLAAYWVGLDGLTTSTVEQDGTFAWCYQGAAYYYTWWEMFPNAPVVVGSTVAPGDRVAAAVSFTSHGYRLTLADTTHPANSFTTTQACPFASVCSNASAEWIAETPAGPRGLWPWAPFGTWRATGAQVTSGSQTGSISSFPDEQIIIVGSDGNSLANTANLNRAGNAFGVTWTHSY